MRGKRVGPCMWNLPRICRSDFRVLKDAQKIHESIRRCHDCILRRVYQQFSRGNERCRQRAGAPMVEFLLPYLVNAEPPGAGARDRVVPRLGIDYKHLVGTNALIKKRSRKQVEVPLGIPGWNDNGDG
jgi:hypothetical protein